MLPEAFFVVAAIGIASIVAITFLLSGDRENSRDIVVLTRNLLCHVLFSFRCAPTLSVISEQIPKGVIYKMLSPQPPAKLPNLENRTFLGPPAILALTEKEAAVSFFFNGERVDYTGFYGKTPYSSTGLKTCFSTIGIEESEPESVDARFDYFSTAAFNFTNPCSIDFSSSLLTRCRSPCQESSRASHTPSETSLWYLLLRERASSPF
jgi:hypothetical protein